MFTVLYIDFTSEST